VVFEAYEVNKKGEKLRCLLLRQKKIFFYDYEAFTSSGKEKSAGTYFSSRGVQKKCFPVVHHSKAKKKSCSFFFGLTFENLSLPSRGCSLRA
jgi:hypothetical protein